MSLWFNIISISMTIFLGLFALLQASKYNKESEKINLDTKDMLERVKETSKNNLSFNKNIYLTNLFTIVSLRSLVHKTSSTALRTDTIVLRKNYNFDNFKNKEIKNVFESLPFIKTVFSNSIYHFLDSDEDKVEVDLNSEINYNSVTDFIKTCDVLFDYGILIYLHNW